MSGVFSCFGGKSPPSKVPEALVPAAAGGKPNAHCLTLARHSTSEASIVLEVHVSDDVSQTKNQVVLKIDAKGALSHLRGASSTSESPQVSPSNNRLSIVSTHALEKLGNDTDGPDR